MGFFVYFPRLIFFCLVWLIPCGATAQLAINEFYYDHPGADDGFEFVEIINSSPGPVGLAGVSIEFHNGAGEGWVTLWVGAATDSAAGGGLFVVGGADVRPPVSAVAVLNLQNGPDAIRLIRDDTPLDVVGYGDLDDEFYVEGESAGKVPSGKSLGRLPDGADTDNNAADFSEMIPSPGLFNVPRYDVSLTPGPTTLVGEVLDRGAFAVVNLSLYNNGLYVIPAGELAVEIRDSTVESTVPAGWLDVSTPIQPRTSTTVSADLSLNGGYHWLLVRVFYKPDERPLDNNLTLLRRVGSPRILVSEVLSYPRIDCPQFVELYNAGPQDQLIKAYRLRDKSSSPAIVSGDSVFVPARGFVVLTSDARALTRFFPGIPENCLFEPAGTWPAFNRSGSGAVSDSVVFSDEYSLPVDAVAYPPVKTDYRGRSLERVDFYGGPRAPVWVLCNEPDGASPGRANSRSLFEPPAAGTVSVSPNPFSPYDGSTASISVLPSFSDVRAVASVYGVNGRKLADLGSATVFPAVFIWDGRGNDGRLLPPGIYVVACEMFSLAGDRIWTEKVVVGCGRKNS